jgi:hypothetical protein
VFPSGQNFRHLTPGALRGKVQSNTIFQKEFPLSCARRMKWLFLELYNLGQSMSN